MEEKITTMKPGLRWSPRPMKEYLSSWGLGPGVAALYARFVARPDVWNLFWISAVNCEKFALNNNQVEFLASAAQGTARGFIGRDRVGDLALRLMPLDFADRLEAHVDQAEGLPLYKTLSPHWLFVIRERSDLFYQARRSDNGLPVPAPNSQGETILDSSSNIVSFLDLKKRGRPGV